MLGHYKGNDEVPVADRTDSSFRKTAPPRQRSGKLSRGNSVRSVKLSHENSSRSVMSSSSDVWKRAQLGGGNTSRENSQALLVGALLDESETNASEHSTVTKEKSTTTTAANASLPESISWRVEQSWKLIEPKAQEVGVDFFLSLFEEHPQAADLFKFGGTVLYRGTEGKKPKVPRALEVHAKKVMDAVGLCVSGMSHLPDLVPTLRTLGLMHGTLGVQDFHYDVVYKHLMTAMERELGPKQFDKQTKEAWEITYRSLTTVMKHPNAVLQIEPLEGWGVVNTVACGFLVCTTPLQMAGILAYGGYSYVLLKLLTFISASILTLDMLSHWVSAQVRPKAYSPDLSKRSALYRKLDVMLFPIKFRTVRFLRSLQMDRWTKWHGMETIVLLSFPLQQMGPLFLTQCIEGSAGVHWTHMFGMLRLVAVMRVVHSLSCAENNLMLRRRQINQQQLLAIRMVKLIVTMLVVIHINACLFCIVARVELGPYAMNAVPSSFFPKSDIFDGKLNPLNSYLHAVHWAWVSLAGIGDTDSTPETSVECLTTLFVHICGATLYTITTGNVVAILEAMTEKQNEAGNDLVELGRFLNECSVPQSSQKRVLQGYMMHQMMGSTTKAAEEHGASHGSSHRAPEAPEAISRLPSHLRVEMATYLRGEAVRRRDRGFAHCSHEFLVAFVGSLKSRMVLMEEDDYVREGDLSADQVAVIVDGSMEVRSHDRVLRRLQVGDVIGKQWLLGESKKVSEYKVGLRAESVCTLISGLSDRRKIAALKERFPNDFGLLKADRLEFFE